MKYVMLDTNIFLDMIVSRNNSNKVGSYDEFMKLLDFDKVKLIIPKIVQAEVYKHIEDEISKIGNTIRSSRKNIQDMYWMNNSDDIEKFNKSITVLRAELGGLVDVFSNSKETFIKEAVNRIDVLFNHRNSVVVEENGSYITNAHRRKVYLRAPEIKEGKDSFADAIIIETLLDIKSYVAVEEGDDIFFITRNSADFSQDNKNKETLHPHLESDFKAAGLIDALNYRIHFTKTLIDDFEDEAKEISVYEDLIREEQEEQAQLEEIRKWDYINLDRQAAGLTELGSGSRYLEGILEGTKSYEISEYIYAELDEYKNKCQEYIDVVEDFRERLEELSFDDLKTKIDDFNENYKLFTIDDDGETVSELISYIDYYISELALDGEGPYAVVDSIDVESRVEFGKFAEFKRINMNNVKIALDGELDPRNDDTDTLYFFITDGNETYECGSIEVYYGYITFNDEGNVDNGAMEEVTFFLDMLFDKVSGIIEKDIHVVDTALNQLSLFIAELLGEEEPS